MNLVIVGSAGTGKHGLSEFLSQNIGIPHISTGEIFRNEVKKGTDLGKQIQTDMQKGQLVPDELTTMTVLQRLEAPDCKNGFVLDGFPRTLAQARRFSEFRDINFVVQIVASDETVVTRLLRRGRADDSEEIIMKRVKQHHELFAPILDFYKSKGVEILTVDSALHENYEDINRKFVKMYGEHVGIQ